MERNTEKAINIAKNGLNKSMVRNIVVKVTEYLLPVVFWLGMGTIFITSLMAASVRYRFWDEIVVFFTLFIPYSLSFIVSFYIIYLLKDIRDSLEHQKDN